MSCLWKLLCGEREHQRQLRNAKEHDEDRSYREALVCYRNAVELMRQELADSRHDKRGYWRDKIWRYSQRIDELKIIIGPQEPDQDPEFHKLITIEEGSIHSYESLFGRYLHGTVAFIRVVDPWIRHAHQRRNFRIFCMMLVQHCYGLEEIELTTTRNEDPPTIEAQKIDLEQLRFVLMTQNRVTLTVNYSNDIHDREIMLSNGYVIDIGRGLDIYQPPLNKRLDTYQRRCKSTKIHIYRQQ